MLNVSLKYLVLLLIVGFTQTSFAEHAGTGKDKDKSGKVHNISKVDEKVYALSRALETLLLKDANVSVKRTDEKGADLAVLTLSVEQLTTLKKRNIEEYNDVMQLLDSCVTSAKDDSSAVALKELLGNYFVFLKDSLKATPPAFNQIELTAKIGAIVQLLNARSNKFGKDEVEKQSPAEVQLKKALFNDFEMLTGVKWTPDTIKDANAKLDAAPANAAPANAAIKETFAKILKTNEVAMGEMTKLDAAKLCKLESSEDATSEKDGKGKGKKDDKKDEDKNKPAAPKGADDRSTIPAASAPVPGGPGTPPPPPVPSPTNPIPPTQPQIQNGQLDPNGNPAAAVTDPNALLNLFKDLLANDNNRNDQTQPIINNPPANTGGNTKTNTPPPQEQQQPIQQQPTAQNDGNNDKEDPTPQPTPSPVAQQIQVPVPAAAPVAATDPRDRPIPPREQPIAAPQLVNENGANRAQLDFKDILAQITAKLGQVGNQVASGAGTVANMLRNFRGNGSTVGAQGMNRFATAGVAGGPRIKPVGGAASEAYAAGLMTAGIGSSNKTLSIGRSETSPYAMTSFQSTAGAVGEQRQIAVGNASGQTARTTPAGRALHGAQVGAQLVF